MDIEEQNGKLAEEAYIRWRRNSACEYTCNICSPQKKFNGSLLLDRHLRYKHGGMKCAEHDTQYGPALTKAVYLQCPSCQVDVLHDYKDVKDHAERHHNGQDLFDYYLDHFYAPRDTEAEKESK